MDDTSTGEFANGSDDGDREFYNGYSVDDEDQPQSTGDSLADDRGLPEPLDEGYSPPERWSVAQRTGNTPYEEAMGESLDERIRQEIAEPDPYAEPPEDPDAVGGELGVERSGRLVAPDEGFGEDAEKDLVARDVGIDGAAASAEEAAVHVIPEPDAVPDLDEEYAER
jgi:hypothetical protein